MILGREMTFREVTSGPLRIALGERQKEAPLILFVIK